MFREKYEGWSVTVYAKIISEAADYILETVGKSPGEIEIVVLGLNATINITNKLLF